MSGLVLIIIFAVQCATVLLIVASWALATRKNLENMKERQAILLKKMHDAISQVSNLQSIVMLNSGTHEVQSKNIRPSDFGEKTEMLGKIRIYDGDVLMRITNTVINVFNQNFFTKPGTCSWCQGSFSDGDAFAFYLEYPRTEHEQAFLLCSRDMHKPFTVPAHQAPVTITGNTLTPIGSEQFL